jgi:hypothetical protein
VTEAQTISPLWEPLYRSLREKAETFLIQWERQDRVTEPLVESLNELRKEIGFQREKYQ